MPLRPGFTIKAYHHHHNSSLSSLGCIEIGDDLLFSDDQVEDPLLLGLSYYNSGLRPPTELDLTKDAADRLQRSISKFEDDEEGDAVIAEVSGPQIPACSSPGIHAHYESKRSLSALSLDPLELNEPASMIAVVETSCPNTSLVVWDIKNPHEAAPPASKQQLSSSIKRILTDEDLESIQESLDKLQFFHATSSITSKSVADGDKSTNSNITAATQDTNGTQSFVPLHPAGTSMSNTTTKRPSLHRRISFQMLPRMDEILQAAVAEEDEKKPLARPALQKAVSLSNVVTPPRRHHRRNTAQILYFGAAGGP